MLQTALDQLDFMRELLGFEGVQRRIVAFAEREESAGELPSGAALVLRDTFLHGEIARGDVTRIAGVSPRTGQTLTGALLKRRLLASDTPKGAVRLGFPADAAGSYFLDLFPAGAE